MVDFPEPFLSLSARRAWIEIGGWKVIDFSITVALRKESVDRNCDDVPNLCYHRVALRKESVDRNMYKVAAVHIIEVSLSARRAWIEIAACGSAPSANGVALRKESVDRNGCWMALNRLSRSRSPQGERG